MASAFREEHHDDPFHDAHEAAVAHGASASGGNGRAHDEAEHNDTGSLAALTNASTADTGDNITNRPVRRELTREKLSRAASASKEWGVSHIKNKWKWYLLGLVIFLAILLPIVFTVALPAVVQLIVNQQELPVYKGALNVLDPNTIKVTLTSSFHIPPGLAAKTNEFVLQMYDKNAPEFSPFLQVEVGPLDLKGGNTNFTVDNQVQKITDQTSVTNWFATFYDQVDVDLSVRGTDATISLGALKSHPRLDKTIHMKGLDGLKGIQMQTLNFLFPGKDGVNIKGDLMLPNRSPLALSFGDITLDLKSGDMKAGNLTLKDITIQPGNQTQSFEGYVDLNAILGNLSGFLKSQAGPLGQGYVQLNATASKILLGGEHVTFLENVLSKRNLTVNISVVTLLTDIISGLLKGGGTIDGNGPQNGTVFINALSSVFANQTLLGSIAGHWTKHAAKRSTDVDVGSSSSLLDDSAMWNLIKLGLKMKAMQK